MRVVYCTSCREMIDRKDIESGRAILYNKASYCPKCTLEASWSDSSRAEPIAPIQAKDTLPGAVPRRRSSGLQGPVVPSGRTARTRRPSTSGIERIDDGGTAPPSGRALRRDSNGRGRAGAGRKSYGLAIGVGIAAFVGVATIGGVVLFSGGDGGGGGPPRDHGHEKPDSKKIVYDATLAGDLQLTDSLEDRKNSVVSWGEALATLLGSSYGTKAEERLRDARQKFLDRTITESDAAEARSDMQRAITLLEQFLEVVDGDPWAQRARTSLSRIRLKMEVPRPDASWTSLFDGREDHQMCLDPKHTLECWQKDDKKLVGQGSADGSSFTHIRSNLRDFNLAFEYRIQTAGFVVGKAQAFEIAFPLTAQEQIQAWHDVTIQSKADRVRVWVDGKEIERAYPSADVEGQVRVQLRPGATVELRNVRAVALR